jgi:ATP-independent RNA helicase DbpA
MKNNSFSTLNINTNILDALQAMQFESMTPIQEQSLPLTLAGDDLIAKSKTGSGKTVAFGIAMLQNLDIKNFNLQSLVICPTRELCEQVATELRKLAKTEVNVKIVTVYGGDSFNNQRRSLEKGAHIVVGTPGRLIDHISKNTIEFLHVKMLVLDEADRMLDMGFFDDISYIRTKLPQKIQTLLFSATYPDEIKKLASELMQTPKFVEIQENHEGYLQQFTCKLKKEERYEALKKVLCHYDPESVIIFCNTKIVVEELTRKLYDDGYDADYFHGGQEQSQRNETLIMFANKSISILVTTNLAARGIDIKEIALVINYELPQDKEVYQHRVGRTARAGESGVSISFYSENEQQQMDAIEELVNSSIESLNIQTLTCKNSKPIQAKYTTLHLMAGKKEKISAGDIVGTFIKGFGIEKECIATINVLPNNTYIAFKNSCNVNKIFNQREINIKNKRVKCFVL